jgi:transcriptional regulator GlxA family with amidase domain
MPERIRPKRLSIVVLPESSGIPVQGIYESFSLVGTVVGDTGTDGQPMFEVETVGPEPGIHRNMYGLPVEVERSVHDVDSTDIVVIGSVIPSAGDWALGRYPETIDWVRAMYRAGSQLASACTGAFVLAETGLLDHRDATTHWAFAPDFRAKFPGVRLRIEELLVVTGPDGRLVTSGGASSWQDLVLHLVARHASPAAASGLGRFFLYHSMRDSQAPYITFDPASGHGDSVVAELEEWASQHYAAASPVEEMIERSGLAPRSFQRRFKRATGFSPLHYVQQLRIEAAKTLLETSADSVDEIAWRVGYREPSAFRRLFKRFTRLTPGEYRRRFRSPEPLYSRN